MKLIGQVADVIGQFRQAVLDRAQFFAADIGGSGKGAFKGLGLHHQHRQSLVDIVMEISGDAAAFLFLHREQPGGQVAQFLSTGGQCLLAGAEKSFRFDMPGDFLHEGLVHVGQLLRPGVDTRLQLALGLAQLGDCPLPLP